MKNEIAESGNQSAGEEERSFDLAQRKAKAYFTSTLVPKEYQGVGNIGNVLIAMNMAKRMGADPLMVMQNLYIVHGKPGWSAQFLVACFNSCGKFSTIKFRFGGERGKGSWSCTAYATELATGETIEGPAVTIEMAAAEGWSTKSGSKWKTMPELMLRYRAAAFLIRSTAPEIGMGIMTADEVVDTHSDRGQKTSTESMMEAIKQPLIANTTVPVTEEADYDALRIDYGALLETATTAAKLVELKRRVVGDQSIDDGAVQDLCEEIEARLAILTAEND